MKKLFCVILALSGALALNASAQTEHHEGDGHDHSASAKQAPGESNIDYFWRMSDAAYHAGDYEKAISFHKRIVAINSNDVESFGLAAWLMWSLGQNDEAVAHIERGVKANPKNSQMWATAGQQYDLQKPKMPGLAVKAKIAYQNAVEFLPVATDKQTAKMLRRRYAHAAQKADDLELSVTIWRKLVADYPNDDVNKNNLARVEKLLAERKRTSMTPLIIGSAGIATIALVGGVLRNRKQRTSHKVEV